jgi:4-deoxy-L-threo-5-hexosulose-uronate ketol-isomerase
MVAGWAAKKFTLMMNKYAISPGEAMLMNTQTLRENFLLQDLAKADECTLIYTHYDRMIVGGTMPVSKEVELPNDAELRADSFLQRREIGIINVAGNGTVKCGDETFSLSKLDCVYLGKGSGNVSFTSEDKNNPAVFFLLSCPAHQAYKNRLMTKEEASPVNLGTVETANERTIYKYIHNDGIESCQLVMGLTVLKEGSVWNTMPAHTHNRRMEAYFYFDVKNEHRVFHMMGQPQETRHMVVGNNEAIISPPWSIHSGCGSSNYSFIWGMAGENKDFTDMDAVNISDIR